MGKLVNSGELGVIFGVSAVTINNWRKDGLPVHEERPAPLGRLFDTEKCIAWFAQKGSSRPGVAAAGERRHEQGRIDKERADNLALKNQILRRRFIPIEVVTAVVAKIANRLAGQLDNLPLEIKRVAPELQPSDVEDVRRLVVGIQNAAAEYQPELRAAIEEAFAGTLGLPGDDDA